MYRGQFNNNGISPIYVKRGYHRSVWLISADWALSWGRQGHICDARQGVIQSPLQSTNIHGIRFNKLNIHISVMSRKRIML